MGDESLVAATVAEDLGTRHEEPPSVSKRALGILSIVLSENRQKMFPISIRLRQSRLQSQAVVETASAPMIVDMDVIDVAQRQIL